MIYGDAMDDQNVCLTFQTKIFIDDRTTICLYFEKLRSTTTDEVGANL